MKEGERFQLETGSGAGPGRLQPVPRRPVGEEEECGDRGLEKPLRGRVRLILGLLQERRPRLNESDWRMGRRLRALRLWPLRLCLAGALRGFEKGVALKALRCLSDPRPRRVPSA